MSLAGLMGADHAFYNERARVLLPFRSIVRAHLVETAASLTSRVGSASSASRLPGTFDSPDHRQRRRARRNVFARSGLHRSSTYSQALAALERFQRVAQLFAPSPSLLDQMAVADFMIEGHFAVPKRLRDGRWS